MLLMLTLMVVGTFVSTAFLQWLWNDTMPELFRIPPVTFWQAFRLLLIAAILIGGPGLVHINIGA